MAFSIEEFKGALSGGGARPSLFDVNITSALNFIGPAQEKLSLTCKASSLPSSTIGKVVPKYFGRDVAFAGDRTFEDWTVTVINDEDYSVYNALVAWSGKINGHETNLNKFPGAASSFYKAEALVNHYGKTGNVIRSVQMVGIFPTNISELPLAWDSTDQIQEFTVTFSLDYWIPAGISAGNIPEVI